MIREVCEIKLIGKRSTQELKDLVGWEETLDRLVKANGVRWYELGLRRGNDDVLRRALNFEVVGKRGGGQPKMT